MIKSLYKTFQHWSNTGSIWVISDPHFDDEDCKLMNENWISPEAHIERLNIYIHKNDTLICLGDCGNLERFKSLKVKNKILIKGNHDDKGDNYYSEIFNEVYKGALFISDKILLSHEPINGLTFCVNIHGHVHNGTFEYFDEFGGKHFNLASDVCSYLPLNLGAYIKSGMLSNIKNIHRETIDRAIEKKEFKNE